MLARNLVRALIGVAICCAILTGAGQSLAQASAESPPGKCSLSGQVVNARSGVPVRRAQVVLRRVEAAGGQHTTSTDSNGEFRFNRLPAGRYRLLISRHGYISQEYGSPGPNLPGEVLDLREGGAGLQLVVRLNPPGVITGRIVDEFGEPVMEAPVEALRYTWTREGGRLSTVRYASTNDLGEFRLYGLPPGRYYIRAALPAGEAFGLHEVRATADGYAPTYYPGVVDPASAAAIEVTQGSESSGINFSLVRRPMFRVRGRVPMAGQGSSSGGVTVLLMARGPLVQVLALSKSTSVDPSSGSFEFQSVIPGSYMVTAYSVGEGHQYLARQPIEVTDADVDGIVLELGPGMELRGSVRVEGENRESLAGITFFLRPLEPLPSGGLSARLGTDGRFLFPSVPAGSYALEVSGVPLGLYLKSATMTGQDVLASGLEITPGRQPGELELVLNARGAQLAGVVVNGRQEPAAEAQILLAPDPGRPDREYRYKIVHADSSGRFTISGIAPGQYMLYAWENADMTTLLDPDILKLYGAQGVPVSLGENSHVELRLRAISGAPDASQGL